MLETIVVTLVVVASVFCIIQLIDLLGRDVKYFESHTHKLAWFLVIIIGNLIGAIWYYIWKRKAVPSFWESKDADWRSRMGIYNKNDKEESSD